MRILSIKLDHIGDFALAVPVLFDLYHSHSATPLDLVVSPVNAGWREVLPWVENLHVIQFPGYQGGRSLKSSRFKTLLDIARLRYRFLKSKYSVAIDLRTVPDDWRGKLICGLSGARSRVGCQGVGDWMLTHKVPLSGIHESEILRGRVETFSGMLKGNAGPFTSVIRSRPHGILPRVVFHPGAGFSAKAWPIEFWIALRSQLASLEVVWLGGEKESDAIALIQERGGFRDEVAISSSIKQSLQILADADLLVGLDSAAPHLAALVNTPAVTIFSSANEAKRWRALGNNVVLQNHVECSPCRLRECNRAGHPCMSGILPKAVAEAVRTQLHSR